MYDSGVGSRSVTDCTFSGNSSGWFGGGISSFGPSSTTVASCTFLANAADEWGGGIYNDLGGDLTVTDCVFRGNTAYRGGGMYGAITTVTNCTFSGNGADFGGGICSSFSLAMVTNCILWDNSASTGPEILGACTCSYSNVQGGYSGTGNIEADPLFVDPGHWDDNGTPADPSDDFWVDGDYHLQASSPCIDAADGDAAPATDIDGNPRHDDPGMPNVGAGATDYADMGAYEFQGDSPVETVTPFGGGCASGAGAVLTFCVLALRRRKEPLSLLRRSRRFGCEGRVNADARG